MPFEVRYRPRIAAVVPPERVTRIGERAANRLGATTCVFSGEEEALAWLRER